MMAQAGRPSSHYPTLPGAILRYRRALPCITLHYRALPYLAQLYLSFGSM